MEFIRGIHNLRPRHRGCVLTIGNFDGVHLGHQAVLARVLQQAQQRQLTAAVMTFEPQPLELFQPQQAPARLTNWREKYQALAATGIQRHIGIEFNRRFAAQPAQQFIDDVLRDKLAVEFLVVGDDFRFGRGREGDFALLQRAGQQYGFDVVDTHSFRQQQQRVSSTAIRQALASADFDSAAAMLGRPYSLSGRVIHGRKNGRKIGFPTANVPLKRLKSPLHGVYAVTVELAGQTYRGVANVGKRPTLNGQDMQLEVHLFDFTGDIYGQRVTVTALAKIRDERRFESLQQLAEQISKDAQQAREVFA
ncbi:bifunctional riboflavin kinase/FAD synthetase [Idiomarina xiamenensis]|uniref:Riboflavin biosynthesis protein n=1 Tax=Idiomarina xiamenensis 10-D-4 TaxID=740709 RepID=K2KDQ7_9GAMM|nr:bifunctional riboflavin kinase/FAD synthetase [Idiomarina xiamenensis]EKE80834.1 FAD synthase [Idiomarina xiamenensis 10-D-4]